ncbi:MAG: (d)CMP kinase [Alphaproteobacteria bacterium]|nr:(d)CMP kinase [Alphaproteobacteria bacterium]
MGAHIAPADDQHTKRFRPLTIAIDGPAASGKGTLARRISTYCGYPYLDTGSLYRMVGLKLIYNGKDPSDKAAAIDAAKNISEQDFSNPRLRQERVGSAASIVSAIPEVRQELLDYQRRFAEKEQGAVLDGRDIGTIVCPEADVKFFITANIEARARRRHRELQGQGIEVVFESVLDDLRERDERDSKREVAALIAADDAIHIDTSDMSAREVFEKVLRHIEEKNLRNIA